MLRLRYFGLAVLVFFATLTTALIVTRCPWWDEGLFANLAANLCRRGILASTVMSPSSLLHIRNLPAVNQYTYWTMPLYTAGLAAWWKIAGISLITARLYSMAWTMVLIASWYAIVQQLTRS